MKPCTCGSVHFRKMMPVSGAWDCLMKLRDDGELRQEESSTDSINNREPKTIRCADCGKRYPNPDKL